MSSCFGENIRVSLFGQSHGEAVGVVLDGLPAGFPLDFVKLNAFMRRRAPGNSPLGTSRREADAVEILSGLSDGRLCGAPLAAIIRNTDARPSDYGNLKDTPRPGHADYTAQIKFGGAQDASGGGHFSGRLTAPLCVAGGVCLQLLASEGIAIGAHIERIGGVPDQRFDPVKVSESDFESVRSNPLPVIDCSAGEQMAEVILRAREEGDSVGGAIECAVTGLPAGVGDPIYSGLENRISSAVFSIPAVKGIEFGSGFDCCSLCGSEHNDDFIVEDGRVRTRTNRCGGILGGISTGMPVLFRLAVKPTPSIRKEQHTVSLSGMENTVIRVGGRHDPCIVPRAVACVEAAAALAVYDAWLDYKKQH